METRSYMGQINFEKTVSQLRFPMICGIVVIHCSLVPLASAADVLCYPADKVMTFCSGILARIFVPLFFFISGYFFFFNKDAERPGFYRTQWRKRIRTLLVPYLLWNIFALAVLAIKTYGPVSAFFPRLAANPITLPELADAFWAFRPSAPDGIYEPSSSPVNVPLWFMRDLMVMALLTPLFHRLLRPKYGFLFPLCLAALFIAGIWLPYNEGCSLSALLFFSGGAWFAIHGTNPLAMTSRIGAPAIVYTVAGAIYMAFAFGALQSAVPSESVFYPLSIITGLFAAIGIGYVLISKGVLNIPPLAEKSSFFIYVFHYPFVATIKPLLFKTIQPHTNLTLLAVYILLIIVTTAVSVGVYALMQRYLPRVTSVLTGAR